MHVIIKLDEKKPVIIEHVIISESIQYLMY